MEKMIVVLVTVGDADSARTLARTLVEEHLAACVNILPGIRSVYRWEDKVADDPELLLFIKTRAIRFEQVKNRVLALHSYDLPEIICLPIQEGHEEYLNWIAAETA